MVAWELGVGQFTLCMLLKPFGLKPYVFKDPIYVYKYKIGIYQVSIYNRDTNLSLVPNIKWVIIVFDKKKLILFFCCKTKIITENT